MTEPSNRSVPDPYRCFFPLGWMLGIWGVLIWSLESADLIGEYPGTGHPDLMIGGSLFSFVCGFLMTAIPRFTGTPIATFPEIASRMLLILGLAVSGLIGSLTFFHAWLLAGVVALIVFVAKRFGGRTANPPPTFVFVGAGLFCGLIGAALMLVTDLGWLGGSWSALARPVYLQGMILSLVLGVGGRLIPALLGFAPMPNPNLPMGAAISSYVGALPAALLAGVVLLLLSFPLEVWVQMDLGRWLRAIVVGFVAYRFWGIQRYPRTATRLAFWLWVSAWLTVLGFLGFAAVPSYSMHLLHVAFIGGFGLMTLLIATRVTVAHGGFPAARWEDSRMLTATAALILAAAVTRLSVAWLPQLYERHLLYASVLWVVALLVWGGTFVTKMVRVAAPGTAGEPGGGR